MDAHCPLALLRFLVCEFLYSKLTSGTLLQLMPIGNWFSSHSLMAVLFLHSCVPKSCY